MLILLLLSKTYSPKPISDEKQKIIFRNITRRSIATSERLMGVSAAILRKQTF
jgi:hypothetical protein